MKKETGLAIFLGVAFGIILSLVMVLKTKDKRLETSKTLTTEKKAQKIVTDIPSQVITFKIISPQDREIVNSNTVTIKGTSEKDALLIVQSPIKDLTYKLEKDDFSVDLSLAPGENVIQLTSYSKDTQTRPQQKELRVYYLDEQ